MDEQIPITNEPVELHTSLNGMQSRKCAKCTIAVRGQFDPVFCAFHRMNGNLAIGWGYIYREEAQLLSLLRARGWTRMAFNDAMENDLAAGMDAATIQEPPPQPTTIQQLSDSDSDASPPGTPTQFPALMAPDYDDL